jgi:integrase/recombinase XerC
MTEMSSIMKRRRMIPPIVERDAAGLPRELSVHCLRHSFVSHQIEDGVDPLFVQQQAGHSWGSTTAVYTTVGADARQRMLSVALARAFDGDDHDGTGGGGWA